MRDNILIQTMLEKMRRRCGGDAFVLIFLNGFYADSAFALADLFSRAPTNNAGIHHRCRPKTVLPKFLQ
jgi:hypothetical protein